MATATSLRVPANQSVNVRPAAWTTVGARVSTELMVSAIASAANADVAPAKLRDTGDADTTSTVIDQMRFSDSSKEEKLTTEFCVSPVRCIGIAGAVRISAGHALAITHCVAVWSESCATPAVSRFAQNGSPDESLGRFLRAAQR